MADYSTEELEKIADKFRSDTSGIRGTKDFTSPEELYDELKKEIKNFSQQLCCKLITQILSLQSKSKWWL